MTDIKPFNILYIQPTGDRKGHYGLYTSHLCQELALLGHKVTLVTNRISPERYLAEDRKFNIVEACNGSLGFEKFDACSSRYPLYMHYGYFRNSFFVLRDAFLLCRNQKFDIVHITGAEFMTASLLLKRYSRSLPPVVMENSAANFTFDSYAGGYGQKLYKVFQRNIYKSVLGKEIRAITVLGEWHKEKLAEQLNISDNCGIEVVFDGGTPPGTPLDMATARNSLELHDVSGPLFLFLGVLRRDKGIEYLFEAVSMLKDSGVTLVVAGHPQDYTLEDIKTLVRHYGIEDLVKLHLYYVDDSIISNYYFASDAIIVPYPSTYTGGSGPLKGALVHGRPSIVTNVADMGRFASNNRIGLVCNPNDATDLALKIMDFIALPQSTKGKFGENAIQLASEHTWGKMAQRLGSLYGKVVSRASIAERRSM